MVDRNQRAGVRPLSTRDSGPLSENPSAFISPKMLLSVEGHAILFSLVPCPHKSRNPDQSISTVTGSNDPRGLWRTTTSARDVTKSSRRPFLAPDPPVYKTPSVEKGPTGRL